MESLLATRLLGRAANWANELWDTLDSTNERAGELARAGAREGVIVMARHQTGGRGRGGRTWISPEGAGLYISFILRPALPPAELPLMSLAAGVAAARAIKLTTGADDIALKWVNDLVAGGKKVGGILCEMPSMPQGQAAGQLSLEQPPLILGIGINLRLDLQLLPAELQDRVDWLERIAGAEVDDNQLAAALAAQVESVYGDLKNGLRSKLVQDWKALSVNLGRAVRATTGDSEIEGTAHDITADGALVIALPGGGFVTVHAGDVMLRNADGSYA